MSSPDFNKCWLAAVTYHANLASPESQQILTELASNAPDVMDVEEQNLINKVKTVAENKTYDPQISPTGKGLLNRTSMEIDRTIGPKAACIRKLNFDDIDSNIPW